MFEMYTGKIRKWHKAPLPFIGQKKDFINQFIDSVVFGIPKNSIDLFGGSGLLSHTVKFYRPDLRVVCNDLDRYIDRLNDIDRTNKIIKTFRDKFGIPIRDGSYERIDSKHNDFIYSVLNSNDGYDWITVSSNILPTSSKIVQNRKSSS